MRPVRFTHRDRIFEGMVMTIYLSIIHLQTTLVNIYSHLLGALACIIASPIAYFKVFGVLDTIQWKDIIVFYIFMAGAIICLSFSASFHCFACHSEPVSCGFFCSSYICLFLLFEANRRTPVGIENRSLGNGTAVIMWALSSWSWARSTLPSTTDFTATRLGRSCIWPWLPSLAPRPSWPWSDQSSAPHSTAGCALLFSWPWVSAASSQWSMGCSFMG